jgi:Flp pilus assembly protein TadG
MKTDAVVPARPCSRELGQDAVEFAIIAPILFLIIIVFFDLGRVTYYWAVLHNAAREGARYGTINPDDTVGIEAAVANLAIGIPPDGLIIDITADDDAQTIEVVVSYNMPIITPIVSTFVGGADTVPLGSRSTLGYEQ